MIRVEGKTIVMSACNCGTSMLVSREGEVFVFGKDTFHCDNTTGVSLCVFVYVDNTAGVCVILSCRSADGHGLLSL